MSQDFPQEQRSLLEWQIRRIEEGLRQADAGEFAAEEEVAEVFAKWRGPHWHRRPHPAR